MSSQTEVEKALDTIFETLDTRINKTVENLIEEIYENYKIFVEYDLLVTALANLIQKGRIKERKRLIYYKPDDSDGLSEFSGITEEEFNLSKNILEESIGPNSNYDEEYDDDLTVEDFEEYVMWVLKKSTTDNPVSLEDLIMGIDAKQRVRVMYDELLPALNNLFEKGSIEELNHLVYYKSEDKRTTTKFSGISEVEFDKTVKSYSGKVTKIFEEVFEEDDDLIRKITIEWYVPEGTFNDYHEEIMDSFTDNLENELGDSSFEVYGYEMGYENGHNNIGIWIIGDPEDKETDDLYDRIIPFVNKFIKERNGRISLIKHYVEKEDELIEI